MPSLLALYGPKQGLCLPLEDICVIGRSSTAHIQLVDAKVSREHCRLQAAAGRVTVEDLGSQNGTFVNGETIAAATALAPGDEIAVGDSLFILDGDIDVLAARYGEATLCLGPSAADLRAAVRARGAGVAPTATAARIGPLARKLQAAKNGEEAAATTLAALEESFAPDRAFVLAATATSSEGLGVRPLCGKSHGAAVAVSRTVLELVRREGQAVLLDDAVADREVQKARSVVRHGLRSVMVAPVWTGAQLVGFLHVDRNGPGAFGAEDLAWLEAIAALAGLAGLLRATASVAPAGVAAAPAAASGGLVGVSAAFREALRLAAAAGRVDSSVLITGESGTGKEELARAIHGQSRRTAGAFVAVNCGAIPEALAESALFGHQKGAFTGAVATQEGYLEAADGGTLFLDEVGELAASVQVKLLRALQERMFFRVGSTTARRTDVRVVAATHRDLEADVAAGRFREDLFFRLNVLRVHVPPLRERPDDLAPLAEALLARVAARLRAPAPVLAPSAIAALARWRWPGNARELGNVLERVLVLREPGDAAAIDGDDVQAALGRDMNAPPAAAPEGDTLADKIVALERREIEAALRRARGVKTQAARALGISRPTLDKKIAELGIDLWADRGAG